MIRRLLMQLSQRDRQASIGRLTSHICHEINNAMQATRGALVLALEKSEASSELASYLSLCKDETQRVVNLVGRMRQIYHPETLEPGPISVDSLFGKWPRQLRDSWTITTLAGWRILQPTLQAAGARHPRSSLSGFFEHAAQPFRDHWVSWWRGDACRVSGWLRAPFN